MSGVFRNIDPPPPHRPASVRGRTQAGDAGWRGGGDWGVNSQTPDTALYSIYEYVRTLCLAVFA
jgi:hypothetical protein